MARTTPDSVALDFERTIPMMGDNARTETSTRGRPPYFRLGVEDGKASIIHTDANREADIIAGAMPLRDMARLLEGMRLADYIRNGTEPASLTIIAPKAAAE